MQQYCNYTCLFCSVITRSHLGTSTETVGDKDLHHFSLIKGLKRRIDSSGFQGETLDLMFGIDGLSSGVKSRKYDIWPILCRLMNCSNKQPFVTTIWCSRKKPIDLDIFFSPFIEIEYWHKYCINITALLTFNIDDILCITVGCTGTATKRPISQWQNVQCKFALLRL